MVTNGHNINPTLMMDWTKTNSQATLETSSNQDNLPPSVMLRSREYEDVIITYIRRANVTAHFSKYAGADTRRESATHIRKENTPRIRAKT